MSKGVFREGKGCVDQIFTLKQICEKAREKKRRVYVGFIDLEKAYGMEALCQVLRMYNVGGKLLGGIKSVYVDSFGCAKVKGGVSEGFRIDSGMRQGWIMFPWLFNVYMDVVMKEVKMGMARRGVKFMEEGREWNLPGVLYG